VKVKTSQRVAAVVPSATMAVAAKAAQMKRQGVDVIDLGAGEPDFDTPQHMIDAADIAMRSGITHYVAGAGMKTLLEAIAVKFQVENGLSQDAAGEIVVTPGGKQALFETIMATIDPGDEVITLEPSWVSYEACILLAGGVPVGIPLDVRQNFAVTKEAVAARVTPHSKMIIVNSPNNPTGRVLTREEIESICEVALENDLLVISDEIYEKLVYDDRKHFSVASLPGMKERTITLNAFSKTYAMTGWRLGYLAGPREIVKQILKVHSHSATCATSFVQSAGVAALKGDPAPVEAMIAEFGRRRDEIARQLNSAPGFHCPLPEGTFYAFPDVRETGMSSIELSEYLLSEAKVAVIPGAAFGPTGEGHLRISFANSVEKLQEAGQRISEALSRKL
jgi:aspartate aminotransferase